MTPMTIEIHGLRLGRGQNDRDSRRQAIARPGREREAVALAIFKRWRFGPIVRDVPKDGSVPPAVEHFRAEIGAGPWLVTLWRVAPGKGLDPHDNLPGSLKHIVDEVASWMGVDDRDELVEWRTEQARGPWGVRVKIEDRERSTT